MPICSCCKEDKPVDAFSFRNKKEGIRHKKCKTCVGKVLQKHYENNKDDYKKRAKNNRHNEYEKTKQLLRSLKTSCVICGEDWPAALDFHHIDPSEKDHGVSEKKSRRKMIAESEKCIVLCSNHHRKFHSGHKETVEKVNALVAQLAEAVGSNPSC